MKNDPIVGKICKVRKQYAERFGNNLHAICEDARRKQGRDQRAAVPANPQVRLLAKLGIPIPIICTPEELLGDDTEGG